ncbi:MAG: histidine kinase [Desulfobacterales bacterium]|nr:MAG: histidine kinase [Desulfobacterales bacterium]
MARQLKARSTERDQVEKELHRLQNYLSNIIDSMPSMLIGVDINGNITQWNKKVSQVTGITSKEAIGLPFTTAIPRLADRIDMVNEAIKTQQSCVVPRSLTREDTENIYEDITIYPLIANGIEGAVIRVDDVTDKVRMEEMIIQSEKMVSVGGLAAGMAHEINNPLAGMMQTAQVMRSRLENRLMNANLVAAKTIGISIEDISAYMEHRGIFEMMDAITESGIRIAEIIKNMLNFVRKSDTTVSSHNPVQLMEKILKLAATDYDLKKQYDFKSIKIIKEYDDNPPMICCEGAKIQQVMLNLLRNGAQAMFEYKDHENFIPQFTLRLAHEYDRNMLRIEVQDNGPGIDKKIQNRIFDPFFTTKPVGIGTGLGLSVSYFIITENHQGTMKVVSQPGKGSNFIICLPLQ